MVSLRNVSWAGLVTASLIVGLALAPTAAAHEGITVGPYVVEIGWRDEPPYVGKSNALEVTITTGDAEPVLDLAPGGLSVVISTAGVNGPSLTLEPAFDAVARTGALGKYVAQVTPTAPGDHTLRLTGSIRDTKVDLTAATLVEVQPASESPGPDPIVLVGGAAVILVLGAMAFLLLGVRQRPTEPPPDAPAP
jgi:hypothetical protein